jgi:hypothetical protein
MSTPVPDRFDDGSEKQAETALEGDESALSNGFLSKKQFASNPFNSVFCKV